MKVSRKDIRKVNADDELKIMRHLTLEARGLLATLWHLFWTDGPLQYAEMAKLCGVHTHTLKKHWPSISQHLINTKDGWTAEAIEIERVNVGGG